MQSVSGSFPEKFWMAEHLGYGGSGPNSDRRLSASIEAPNTIVLAVPHPVLALFVHFPCEMVRNGQFLIEFHRTTRRSRPVLSLITRGLQPGLGIREQCSATGPNAAPGGRRQSHSILQA